MIDSDQQYRATIARKILQVILPVCLAIIVVLMIRVVTYENLSRINLISLIAGAAIISAIYALIYYGQTKLAGHLFIVLISLLILTIMVFRGGIRATAFAFMVVPLGYAIWIYSKRALAIFYVLTISVSAGFLYLGHQGYWGAVEQIPLDLVWLYVLAIQLLLLATTYIPRQMLYKVIDENERKNEQLRQAGNQYKDLVEETDDLITRVNGDGKIVFVNHASNKIYGLKPEDCLGLLAVEFDHEDDRAETAALFETFLLDHVSNARFQNRQVSKSGEVFDISWQVKFGYDEDGNILQVDGIGRNITERVQAEKIQEVLYDISQASVISSDLESLSTLVRDHLGKVIDTTNFYIALYDEETGGYFFPGYFDDHDDSIESYAIIPRSFTDLVRQTGKSLLVDQAAYKNLTEKGEIIIYGVDSLCWLGVPLKTKNGVIGVIGIQDYDDPMAYTESHLKIVDNVADSIASGIEIIRARETEQKLNARLNRAERMETLGMLAGGVAHDLNNILVPIVTYPDIILSQLPENSGVEDDILEIKKAAENASDIIGDLLTLARRGDYTTEVLNLNEVIDNYISSASFKSTKNEKAKVALHLDLAENLANISGSATHLSKVIMNLVSNAIQSYESDGALWIQTRNETVSRHKLFIDEIPSGDYSVVEVKDQGSGISEKLLNHIFDPFYTTKAETRTKGTGLGLSIVSGIAHDHGAFLDVTTEVGKGTTFTLYFQQTQESLPDQIPAEDIPKGNESILVIDDMDNQIKIVKTILTSLGYSVTGTIGGRMGVEYLRRNKVDLVILDMIMEEDFDGLKTFQEILKIHPHQKAIIVSGYSESDKVRETLALGALAYLSKPYTVPEMGQAVREALDR